MAYNFIISVTSQHLASKCAYSYLGMSMTNSVMKCVPILHNSSQVDECVHKWHLVSINILDNIFPLHTRTKKNYHLKYPNVLH